MFFLFSSLKIRANAIIWKTSLIFALLTISRLQYFNLSLKSLLKNVLPSVLPFQLNSHNASLKIARNFNPNYWVLTIRLGNWVPNAQVGGQKSVCMCEKWLLDNSLYQVCLPMHSELKSSISPKRALHRLSLFLPFRSSYIVMFIKRQT